VETAPGFTEPYDRPKMALSRLGATQYGTARRADFTHERSLVRSQVRPSKKTLQRGRFPYWPRLQTRQFARLWKRSWKQSSSRSSAARISLSRVVAELARTEAGIVGEQLERGRVRRRLTPRHGAEDTSPVRRLLSRLAHACPNALGETVEV
jgi:hypothetical protein